jgi:hypothetical protein
MVMFATKTLSQGWADAFQNENRKQTRSTEESRQESGGDHVRFIAAVFGRRAAEKNEGNPQDSGESRS